MAWRAPYARNPSPVGCRAPLRRIGCCDKAWGLDDAIHGRRGLRHRVGDPAPAGDHVVETTRVQHTTARFEHIFEARGVSSSTGFESPDTVPSLRRNVHLDAEGDPHLARRHAGIQRGRRRAVADPRDDQIVEQRSASGTELIVDGATEFTAPHGLSREGGRSPERQLGVDGSDEVVRDHVRERLQTFEHGQAVAHLAHDRGDRHVESLGQ